MNSNIDTMGKAKRSWAALIKTLECFHRTFWDLFFLWFSNDLQLRSEHRQLVEVIKVKTLIVNSHFTQHHQQVLYFLLCWLTRRRLKKCGCSINNKSYEKKVSMIWSDLIWWICVLFRLNSSYKVFIESSAAHCYFLKKDQTFNFCFFLSKFSFKCYETLQINWIQVREVLSDRKWINSQAWNFFLLVLLLRCQAAEHSRIF